jgi:RimJ/RimL family protein N-acetyltransferase
MRNTMNLLWITAERLEGAHVVLEPLRLDHIAPLVQAVNDGEAWRLWYAAVPNPQQMQHYVEQAILAQQRGDLAYAVYSKQTGQVVGTTRYYNVEPQHKRAMIGYTWYADSARRSPINTECKLLLLSQLFETHQAIAVEFRTHFSNATSRAAIERLGAKLDGILRHHQIMPNGTIRDTAVYSIIGPEWPAVKCNLLSKLS